MIEPPRRGEPYPGRMPPVSQQLRLLPRKLQLALVVVPAVVVGVLFVLGVEVGIVALLMVFCAYAPTLVYLKNRTDRHNAAYDAGELPPVTTVPLLSVGLGQGLPEEVAQRLDALGLSGGSLGSLVRFEGGWIACPRARRGLGVVIGDDGGHALFDARKVSDEWAAKEYVAGRGREPAP